VIRAERPGDEDAIRAVETAAFGRESEARIVDEVRPSHHFIPELSLVAEEDGRVVGHVMVSWAHVEPGGERILLLGPIGVVPDRQGGGIGGALVEAALSGGRALGQPCVVLLGDPKYYGRFGFVRADELGVLPSPDTLHPWAFQIAILDAGAALPQGRVVYSEPFRH
jgi:putative acetyltransferase